MMFYSKFNEKIYAPKCKVEIKGLEKLGKKQVKIPIDLSPGLQIFPLPGS